LVRVYKILIEIGASNFSLIILISPPVLYSLERGSLDIQVLAVLLFLHNKVKSKKYSLSIENPFKKINNVKVDLISGLLFTYLTIIKFYPIVFFFLAILFFKGIHRIIYILFFATNIIIAIYWLDAQIFLFINNPYNQYLPVGILNYIRYLIGNPLATLLIILILVIIIKNKLKYANFFKSKFDFYTLLPFMIFSIFWLIAGSASYRIIFLDVCLLLFLQSNLQSENTRDENRLLYSSGITNILLLIYAISLSTGFPIINNTFILLLLITIIKSFELQSTIPLLSALIRSFKNMK
jgi:hypothetical protein